MSPAPLSCRCGVGWKRERQPTQGEVQNCYQLSVQSTCLWYETYHKINAFQMSPRILNPPPSFHLCVLLSRKCFPFAPYCPVLTPSALINFGTLERLELVLVMWSCQQQWGITLNAGVREWNGCLWEVLQPVRWLWNFHFESGRAESANWVKKHFIKCCSSYIWQNNYFFTAKAQTTILTSS